MTGTGTADAAIQFEPLDSTVHADPYPHYALLRERAPVHRTDYGRVVATRYTDVASLQGDSRFVNGLDATPRPPADPVRRELRERLASSMMFREGEEHRRLRRLVTRAFTPKAVQALQERIAEVVDGLLDALLEARAADFVADFARPLPVTVICELLGIPEADRDRCLEAAEAIGLLFDPVHSDDDLARVTESMRQFDGYAAEVVEERRRQPTGDLISELATVEEGGDRLTAEELVTTISVLFGAGHETTVNLLGNGMLALLRHPEQFELLRARPDLVTGAVEEMLRFDSPVQMHGRLATEDAKIGGFEIKAGEHVVLLVGAAHRDPDRYEDADRFDVTRPDPRPLSFGGGPHHCLGATLARTEARIALGGILARLGRIELTTDDLHWRPHITLRGLAALPVQVGV